MIIWIRGNLQQLVAYGLGLQLMSTNRYEMLVDWEQYGESLHVNKQARSNVVKHLFMAPH